MTEPKPATHQKQATQPIKLNLQNNNAFPHNFDDLNAYPELPCNPFYKSPTTETENTSTPVKSPQHNQQQADTETRQNM
jgi:hypothetical protein